MRRHSARSRKPAKVRHRKAAKAKLIKVSGAARLGKPCVGDLQAQVSALTHQLVESQEQQEALAEVLEVISRSAFDLNAVFETVVERSARLSGAAQARANIYRFDGELMRLVASFNVPEEVKEWLEQHPIRPGRYSGSARAALERRTIHVPDILADPEYSYGAKTVEPYRTILAVPILKDDDLLGVLLIYLLEVRPFRRRGDRIGCCLLAVHESAHGPSVWTGSALQVEIMIWGGWSCASVSGLCWSL